MKTNRRRTQNLRSAAWVLLCMMAVPPAADGAMLDSQNKSDARQPYALLFGTVFDSENRPVYGVKIKIRAAAEKKPKWELYSDHSGEFAQRVPAGNADYIVWADIKTAKGDPKPEVKVHVENDERRDFFLHLR
jgi:hypothetical protein